MLMNVNAMSGAHVLVLCGVIRETLFKAAIHQNGYAGICDRVVIHCHSLNRSALLTVP
jgi:hypothetical protein